MTPGTVVLKEMHPFDIVSFKSEFENGDQVVRHELRRYWSANEARELLGAARNVLLRLHRAETVGAAFRLDGNNELCTAVIDADVDFVDLDLTLHRLCTFLKLIHPEVFRGWPCCVSLPAPAGLRPHPNIFSWQPCESKHGGAAVADRTKTAFSTRAACGFATLFHIIVQNRVGLNQFLISSKMLARPR